MEKISRELFQECVDIYIAGVVAHPQIKEKERREAIHQITDLVGREMDDFYNKVGDAVWYQDSHGAPLD